MKNVLMNEEAREKLIAGVNLAADVAAVTFGPNGHTVISGNHITKDGMTAVSWIQDPDPFVMMGVNLIKDISKKTAVWLLMPSDRIVEENSRSCRRWNYYRKYSC